MTKKEAICQHLGMDAGDIEDYRYRYGHTTLAVYAVGDNNYCVTRGKEKPAADRDGIMEWVWNETPDPYINEQGLKIWRT